MSASAVRGGQVYVEIGANPNRLLNALRIVNTQVGDLGDAVAGVGMRMAAAGSAVFAPIAAAGAAFAAQTEEVARAQRSLAELGSAVGSAVAPAVVGLANAVSAAADATARFVRENPNLVRQAAMVAAIFAGGGTALVVFGNAIASVTRASSAFLKPVYDIGRLTVLLAVNLGRLALSAVMAAGKMVVLTAATIAQATAQVLASNGVALFAAGIAGIAVAIAASSVKLDGFNSSLSVGVTTAVATARDALAGMAESATTAMTGVFNAISSGDITGAMEIAWAGAVAVWLQGQKTIMDAIDPFVSMVQNAFDYLRTNVVNNWDSLRTDSAAAVRILQAVLLGIFDNLSNAVMVTFDTLVGNVQKAWIRVKDFFTGATDTQQKIEAIDKENQKRADQRGKANPGMEKRLADAVIANQLHEGAAIERQRRNRQQSEDRMVGREDANRQRAADRAAAVDAAKTTLSELVGRTSEPPPVTPPGSQAVGTAVAGTFSAFGLEQMAGGGNVQKQQLDALLKIQAGIEESNRVGVVVA